MHLKGDFMKIKTYSYRYAEEILQHPKYKNVYEELLEVCKNAPIPVYKGKSEKQKNKDIIQQLINTYFYLRFKHLEWECEPLATPENFEDALRGDFRKKFNLDSSDITLQIEVEFGNVASSYRNYFKFQLSYSYELTDICILIVPCYKLSTRIDSGVSNFEKVKREIPSARLSITVPTLIIGLDDEGEEEWDVKSIENNLEILKNSKDKYRTSHMKIVQDYIDSLY